MNPSSRVFIYGSCVSRDPFELPSDLTLVDYFARTSLASAFRQPPAKWEPDTVLDKLKSNFQRRMVETDVRKTLGKHIADSDFDFLVLDFIDERMSTIEFNGSTITESAELKSTGFEIDPDASYEPWTEMGMHRRRDGLQRLLEICDPRKVVVNRVFWATHDSNGKPLSHVGWIEKNNAFLAEMYEIVGQDAGVRFIDYPDGLLVADAAHKWGVQAYHFTNEANLHFLSELQELTAS